MFGNLAGGEPGRPGLYKQPEYRQPAFLCQGRERCEYCFGFDGFSNPMICKMSASYPTDTTIPRISKHIDSFMTCGLFCIR